MLWLKAVMQRLGKMVCLFTTPSMQVTDLHYCNANKQLATFGQACQDAQEQQPAQSKPKRKRKVVQADTTEQSLKQTQKVAQPTIVEASPKRTRKPALTTNGKDGSQQVTPVSKTPQRAKAAPTKKAKAVVSTTQGKKRTQGKTSAKTPTVRQRKVRGA